MAKKEFFLTKWIRGWRLDRVWSNLFADKNVPVEPISVKEATAITVEYLQKAYTWLEQGGKAILLNMVGPEADKAIEAAYEAIPLLMADLLVIQTLPDIADATDKYEFSKDPAKNELLHDVVHAVAYSFGDGRLSWNDMWQLVSLVVPDNE